MMEEDFFESVRPSEKLEDILKDIADNYKNDGAYILQKVPRDIYEIIDKGNIIMKIDFSKEEPLKGKDLAKIFEIFEEIGKNQVENLEKLNEQRLLSNVIKPTDSRKVDMEERKKCSIS